MDIKNKGDTSQEMTYADLLKELIEENKRLILENERLKKQLEEIKKPSELGTHNGKR